MRQHAVVAGVGMTPFGKHLDRSLAELARDAIRSALADADVPIDRIQAAWAGNAAAGLIVGQVCIAGQAILRGMGIGRIPIVNVENACATASTAFQQACTMVTLGVYDVVLAFGVEKLHHPDRARVLDVFAGCINVDAAADIDRYIHDGDVAGAPHGNGRQTVFVDLYARMAKDYMRRSGATARDFARIHLFSSLPIMLIGTLLPLRPIKGWLVASQFVNRAQEHGTRASWARLNGTDPGTNDFDQ